MVHRPPLNGLRALVDELINSADERVFSSWAPARLAPRVFPAFVVDAGNTRARHQVDGQPRQEGAPREPERADAPEPLGTWVATTVRGRCEVSNRYVSGVSGLVLLVKA